MLVREPVLLRVYYFLPDYNNLVQEFTWGTVDVIPEYPRINKEHIDGLQEYTITYRQ